MPALPNWVGQTLEKHRIVTTRYGRDKQGRPTALERRWFFCGWYYHKEIRDRIVDGPHGPYPCESAAMTAALRHYELADPD